MLGEISARQLQEWMAFEALDPSGERRADLRIAWAIARLASVLTGKAQRPGDYMIELEPKEQSWQEMRAQFTMAAGVANAHNRSN